MSTDRKDQVLSLGARDDLLAVVAMWPALVRRLTPGGGNAQNGCVSSSGDPRLPIDVNVSDLMREVEDCARFWGQALCEETTWAPTTSAMPTLLAEVAARHGHFTANERDALEFTDTAHQLREKVRKVVEQRESPRWVGPCQTVECVGELYVGAGKDGGTCRVCGSAFTLLDQQAFIFGRYQERLMTPAEIGTAFKVLDIPRAEGTIRSWISRGRLVAVQEGLYSLADAKALAEKVRGIAA